MSQQFENLSEFVDGENSQPLDAKQIAGNPELVKKWKSYHLTRDVMRGDMTEDLSFDISDRIAAALNQEMPILAPQKTWRDNPVVSAVIPIVKQSSQLAMAACVTAFGIFGYQSLNQPEEAEPFTSAPGRIGPMGGLSPVSLQQTSNVDQNRMAQVLEQHRHMNALIADHNRQLRLKELAISQREKDLEKEQETPQPE